MALEWELGTSTFSHSNLRVKELEIMESSGI